MPNSPALGEFTLGLAELGAGTQIFQMFESLALADSTLLDLVTTTYETLALADSITAQWLVRLADAMGIDDKHILDFIARPSESVDVSDLVAAQVETIVNELLDLEDAARSTRLIVMLDSFGLTDAQITAFTSRPQEPMNIGEDTATSQEITTEESLSVADGSKVNATLPFNEAIALDDEVFSSRIARAFETMALADAIATVIETEVEEYVTVTDSHIMTQAISMEQGLNFAESTYLLTEVIVGVKGFISTILDIDSTDFCSLVDETGHVVQKTNVTPVFDFQAFLFQKQTRQLFDFGITTFPGDAVMFYCPELDPPLEVGDELLSNGIYYNIIEIRDKLMGPNIIYKKAALRKRRETDMLPKITMFGASPNESGSSTVSWSPIDSTQYPWLKEYEVFISEDDIDYISYRKTTGTSISATGLEPGKTYYFKVRGISMTTDAGPLSDPVDCSVPTDSLVVHNLMATLNTSGSSVLSWSPVSSVDYGYLSVYQIFISENDVDFTLHREVTPSTLSVTGLVPGKTYYFKVRAVSKFGDTGPLTASVNCGLPVAELEVTDLACTLNDNGSVTLTWSPVDSTVYDYIKLYQVFISENGTDYRLHREPTTPTLTLANLVPGITLYFKVRAVSKFEEIGAFAGPVDSAVPPPVMAIDNLACTENVGGSVSLTWSPIDSVDYGYIRTYQVFISEDGTTFNLHREVSSPNLILSNLEPGKTYYFKVRAVNRFDEVGVLAGPVDSLVPTASLAITGIFCSVNDSGSATVQWSPIDSLVNEHVDKYQVQGSSDGVNFDLIREVSVPTFTQSNLVPYSTHYFRVRAVDKFGNVGAWSTVVNSALPAFNLVDVPWIRIGDNADGTVELRWGQLNPDVYTTLKTYRVYCQAPGTTYNLIGTTTGQSFNAKVPDPNVAYFFKVIPEDIYGRANITAGAYVSNKDFRNLIAAVVIGDVRAVGGVGKMDVYWNDIRKATSDQTLDYYEIEYAKLGETYRLGHTTTSNQCVFSALTAGTWRVRVRAIFKSRDYTAWAEKTGVAVT